MIKFILLGLCCTALVSSCAKKNKPSESNVVGSSLTTLPMDSSLAIIMATTGLLSVSCIPNCWHRAFRAKKQPGRYICYVMEKTSSLIDGKEFDPEKLIKSEPTIDSPFYPLIRQLAVTKPQSVTVKDTRPLWNQLVKVGIISTLKKLTDNELGYICTLPVVTNKQGDKAVFVYEIMGDTYASWFVCAQLKRGKWIVVNKTSFVVS